jgi:hypothetical protein
LTSSAVCDIQFPVLNMIAVGTGESWILIGFAILTLRAVWVMLSLTFDLIESAHERLRAAQPSQGRREARVRGDGSNF